MTKYLPVLLINLLSIMSLWILNIHLTDIERIFLELLNMTFFLFASHRHYLSFIRKEEEEKKSTHTEIFSPIFLSFSRLPFFF